MDKINKTRTLKVYGKHTLTCNKMALNPEIRLTGKWVEKWGFMYGNIITVRKVESGQIIINNITNSPPIIEL